MSTTLLTARTRVRSMIREATANQWSDARLNQLIQDADWAEFINASLIRNSGLGQIQEDITLPANASTFSLTPGAPPTGFTYNLEGILFIEHLGVSGFWNPCAELQEGDEFRYRAVNAIVATGDVPPLYRLRRPNLLFLPIANADRTLRVTYRPLPVALSGDNVALNIPDVWVPLVCTRAAVFALADLGESETQLGTATADGISGGAYELLRNEMYLSLGHPGREGMTLGVKLIDTPALFSF